MRLEKYINESLLMNFFANFGKKIISSMKSNANKVGDILNDYYKESSISADSESNGAIKNFKSIFTSRVINDKGGDDIWWVTTVKYINNKWVSNTKFLKDKEPIKKGMMFDFSDKIVKDLKPLGIDRVYFNIEKN